MSRTSAADRTRATGVGDWERFAGASLLVSVCLY